MYCNHNNLSFLPKLPNTLMLLSCTNNKLTELKDLPNSIRHLYIGNNDWIEPIPNKYFKLAKDKIEIYTNEQIAKFTSYQWQKEFIEKYPFKIKNLEILGVNPEIRKEYAYLWDFDEYIN